MQTTIYQDGNAYYISIGYRVYRMNHMPDHFARGVNIFIGDTKNINISGFGKQVFFEDLPQQIQRAIIHRRAEIQTGKGGEI